MQQEELNAILRDDWREQASSSLLKLIDRKKLSLLSTKEIKELLNGNSPPQELAAVLNMKTQISNKKAYRDYKRREKKEQSQLSRKIETMHLEKKRLIDERSSLMTDILFYQEYFASQ